MKILKASELWQMNSACLALSVSFDFRRSWRNTQVQPQAMFGEREPEGTERGYSQLHKKAEIVGRLTGIDGRKKSLFDVLSGG
jgi:hypothetical protein